MMGTKYYRLLIIAAFILIGSSCSNNNNDLPNLSLNKYVYLNSAKYENLNYAGGYVVLEDIGIVGVLLYHSSSGKFKAYEMTCPQKKGVLTECYILETKGNQLQCPCDNSYFDMETGLPATDKSLPALKEYKVEKVNDLTLLITN